MFTAPDREGKIRKQLFTAKAFGQVLDFQDVLPADFVRFKRKMHGIVDFLRLFQPFDFAQHFLPAFRPFNGFFPVEGFELRNDFFLMTDFLLLILPGLKLYCTQLLLFFGIRSIAAGKHSDDAVFDFDDFSDNPVKEVTVMGHHDDSAGIVL